MVFSGYSADSWLSSLYRTKHAVRKREAEKEIIVDQSPFNSIAHRSLPCAVHSCELAENALLKLFALLR